jgi:hypothetical protein
VRPLDWAATIALLRCGKKAYLGDIVQYVYQLNSKPIGERAP